jgi:5-methyltetrahydropteroyltriglutamate--homocysteine methyltransferase
VAVKLPDLPLLPTQVIGSSPVPSWLGVFRDAVADGKVGPADVAEALRDAADLALLDMRESGVDIVSDGEMFRADFTWNFHERIRGLEPIPFERRLGYPGPDQLDAFRCVEPLSVPDGYGLEREIDYLQSHAERPFVVGLQSPVTQAFRIDPAGVYASKGEVAWALVPFVNAELKRAAAAGAPYLQFDEPAFWTMPGGYAEMVEIFNACVEGVDTTIGIHLCFGNFRGRAATSDRRYRDFAPHFAELDADVIHLEFASRGMSERELWAEYGGDKILSAGVIDVKGRSVEPVDVVADRIRGLLDHVAPERLWLAPDCGFSQTARVLAVAKLRSLVEAARVVRRELGA